MILSLDLGRCTGWALIDDDRVVGSGIVDYSSQAFKSDHHGRMLLAFLHWLVDNFGGLEINEVFTEEVMCQHRDHQITHYGLRGVVSIFCQESGARLVELHNTTVKKLFCGTGRADKNDICQTAIEMGWPNGRPGTDFNHDEADAIAIAYAIMDKRNIVLTIGKYRNA